MCGKFTAMASWSQVVAFSQPLISNHSATVDDDREISFRVMNNLPVIIWNCQTGKRQVVPMRWGFPHRDDPRRPDPIHVRAETIDVKPTFRDAFLEGQRGIVMVKTFNEGLELANGKTEQHVIDPDGAAGIAVLWRRFGSLSLPACVMATVPANNLIGAITDRMPAILAPEDWAIWLGEDAAPHDRIKACLKTTEGVRWTMTPEQRAARPRRKPTMSDPGGLF